MRRHFLLIVLAGILVYTASLSNPLVFDDTGAVSGNQSIRQLSPLSSLLRPPDGTPVAGRPLVNTTFAINYAMGGLDVTGYRVTNLLIHLLAALTVYGVVRRTLGLRWAAPLSVGRDRDLVALASAVLWVVHPLASEPVVYVAHRSMALMGLCYLLTIYASIRAASTSRRGLWTAAAIAASAAGMLSHEVMATAPLLVVIFDRVFLYDSWRETWSARARLYAGLVATWLVLLLLFWLRPPDGVGWGEGVGAWTYLANQPSMIARYMWLSLWPRPLVLDYGLPRSPSVAGILLPAVAVLMVVAATAVFVKKRPALAFLGLWFLLTLAPSSSVVPIATEVGAERRMYLPLVAVVVLAAAGLHVWLVRGDAVRSQARRRTWTAVVALACLLLGVGTVLRSREFRSEVTLAESSVARWPHGRARVRLAASYAGAARQQDAIAQLRLAVADYAPARLALATQLLAGGSAAEAASSAAEFVRLAPSDPQVNAAHALMGRAYALDGKLDLAAAEFGLLTQATPRDPEPFARLGDIRLRQSRFDEAIPRYATALQLRPNDPDVYRQLGLAFSASRRMEDAVEAFARAVEARPNDIALLNFLGRALGALGRYQEAVLPMSRVVELAPSDRQAQRNLAILERLAQAQQQGQRPGEAPASASVLTGRQ